MFDIDFANEDFILFSYCPTPLEKVVEFELNDVFIGEDKFFAEEKTYLGSVASYIGSSLYNNTIGYFSSEPP